jgi:hypothetical protein
MKTQTIGTSYAKQSPLKCNTIKRYTSQISQGGDWPKIVVFSVDTVPSCRRVSKFRRNISFHLPWKLYYIPDDTGSGFHWSTSTLPYGYTKFVTHKTSMELCEVWDSYVDEYEHKCILGNPEDGSWTFLRNADNFLPDHTASNPIRQQNIAFWKSSIF